MICIDARKKAEDWETQFLADFDGSSVALSAANRIPGKMAQYQRLLLYGLAKQYDWSGASLLDIGTLYGNSAAIMALAAPKAAVTTINPRHDEMEIAQAHFKALGIGIQCIEARSWELLAKAEADATLSFDLILVDGDHNAVALDLPWYNHLRENGLILFHDYSPANATVPSPVVFATLDLLCVALHNRRPDVRVIDTNDNGMVGFYRWKEADIWPMRP